MLHQQHHSNLTPRPTEGFAARKYKLGERPGHCSHHWQTIHPTPSVATKQLQDNNGTSVRSWQTQRQCQSTQVNCYLESTFAISKLTGWLP